MDRGFDATTGTLSLHNLRGLAPGGNALFQT